MIIRAIDVVESFGKYIGIMVLVQFERGPVQNIGEYTLS